MPERGGPTTQSGIFYQNSVAALYLGRMCDSGQREDAQRVSRVRVEAPVQVDDTVVTFADSHCGYIQAKEKIRSDHSAWVKLWQDFVTQFQRSDFQRGKDRLIVHIGESYQEHHELQEACERTQTSDTYTEWWGRLNKRQKALIEKIKPLLKPELLSDQNLLTFFGHIDVELWPLRHIERDLVPNWMPPS